MPNDTTTWKSVREEVNRRIQDRVWPPGAQIPTEAELAVEFGCARVTVNRALRDLADAGLLDRRRKAGTTVAEFPVRKANFEIPIIRKEIEAMGQPYGYALVSSVRKRPPPSVRAIMALPADAQVLSLRALHLSAGRPFVFEDRWINLGALPDVGDVDFNLTNANEWLVQNARFTHGELVLEATSLAPDIAAILETDPGQSVVQAARTTWDGTASITHVQMIYAPGYQLRMGF